jgi:hypothetical protein
VPAYNVLLFGFRIYQPINPRSAMRMISAGIPILTDLHQQEEEKEKKRKEKT